ncbi:restriction endonuclease subunit S [Parabacteroides johnsonii]|uniref:restriction endonuclease subunit S n=1 Tax=Parabacteroides johnsonii TaxID=387661 RepID=UPI001C8B29A9|nr:restriction endonuclease subunit S [Parabacteroides johnsonii]MBX9108858.1 restriction endonuclease subunit S [Parabacteroides johnsonii]
MTKDKDIKTVVPALRFPEFRDGEGWKIVSLGEVCDVVGGGTPDTKEDSYWNGDILWLTPSEVGNRFISDSCRKITLSGLKNSSAKLLPAGSIVLTTRATLGEMSILVTEASTNQGFQSLVPKLGTNKDYIYYLQPIIKEQCLRFSKGSTFLEVSSTSVKNFKIPFTSNKEQEKVADCLGSMDDLISSVADKIETLKEYKKGLMQQLFPAEGKTIPAIRFPEFQNAREWKQIKLRDVGEPLMCKRILKEQTTNEAVGNIPFYKIGTFGGNPDAYISKDILEDYKRKYSYPNKGDILISAAGTIGRLVVFDGKPAYFQDSNIVWIGNSETKILNAFLYRVYQTLKWQTSDGGIVSRLYNSDLKNMTIIFPENKIEQQKIADCLLSVDELISTEIAKLDQLKAHKKGLMQQLFPKLQ